MQDYTPNPSSTTKRLLSVFESNSADPSPNDSMKESSTTTTPASKRMKETSLSQDSNTNTTTAKVSEETTVLPHQTPIAKYLRLPPMNYNGETTNNATDSMMTSLESSIDGTKSVIVTPKRHNYLSWDDYFLGTAILSSQRSKDPDHAEGACIVDTHNRIVAIGYNGFPKGCPDTVFPWHDYEKLQALAPASPQPWLHSKQPYVCPAITNAILNKCSQDVEDCRLYVMEFPSSDCVKVLIQSGISEIIVLKTGDTKTDETTTSAALSDDEQASRIMLEMANISLRYHQPSIPSITLNFAASLDVTNGLAPTTSASSSSGDTDTNNSTNISSKSYTDEEQHATNILQQGADYDASAIIDNGRRKDYISWDDYFMGVAFLTAQRSKDPNTQVGACIVDEEHRIVGLGYNGMPRGLSDDAMPWSRDSSNPPVFNKYLYVTHAEVNAILNKGSANVKGSTIYVALFPCNDCAKMIIQAGIRKVVYLSDRYRNTDACRASRILLRCANVELVQYTPTRTHLTIKNKQ